MSTSARATAGVSRGRAPIPLRAAAALLPLLVVAHLAGVVMFGLVWADDPIGPGLVYLAFATVTAATAVASLPRLLRGERLAWLVVTGWVGAFDYWSVYKVFGMPEYESMPFLGVGLLLAALLVHPRSVAHVGGLR